MSVLATISISMTLHRIHNHVNVDVKNIRHYFVAKKPADLLSKLPIFQTCTNVRRSASDARMSLQPSATRPDGEESIARMHASMPSNDDSATLKFISNEIRKELQDIEGDDAIHACGRAALSILHSRPHEALQLAKDHIQYQPYRDVQRCWLRLYEDASLWRAAELLCNTAEGRPPGSGNTPEANDWMLPVIRVLDLGLIVSGGMFRGELYEAIFANLEPFVENLDKTHPTPTSFNISQPKPLQSERLAPIASKLTLEAFQLHLDNQRTPLLLTGVIADWPAVSKWQDPSHLLRLTLGGRRAVPIEIGETYTHADWRQEIVSFRAFMRDYLLPAPDDQQPREIGYLGQHNLFHQIPALQRDIRTPDYCFSAPPETIPASRLGLPPTPPVDEPQRNVWLGPKGTRTPLHTDPYHNIFCQVWGYKYVRLYPPEASESVHPRGVDENGIDESNTSLVEIKFDRQSPGNVLVEDGNLFPRFGQWKEYREAIVGPGECLYIPAGWWHYVEALTASCSVSFWWN